MPLWKFSNGFWDRPPKSICTIIFSAMISLPLLSTVPYNLNLGFDENLMVVGSLLFLDGCSLFALREISVSLQNVEGQ